MTKQKISKPIGEADGGELIDFNFPAFDVTVQAHDTAEAEEKLQQILKSKK